MKLLDHLSLDVSVLGMEREVKNKVPIEDLKRLTQDWDRDWMNLMGTFYRWEMDNGNLRITVHKENRAMHFKSHWIYNGHTIKLDDAYRMTKRTGEKRPYVNPSSHAKSLDKSFLYRMGRLIEDKYGKRVV